MRWIRAAIAGKSSKTEMNALLTWGASLPTMVPSGPDTHQTQQLPVPDPELRIQLGAVAPLGGQVRQ